MAIPVVAVLGASGKQGSSIASHLSRHYATRYALRAIVRNPSKYSPPSPSVEVVQGDYSSTQTLLPALAGASVVFALTNPDWTFRDLEAEWGRNIGDAVLATPSVRLFIFSGASDAPRLSDGTLRCYNFAGKAAAQKYIAELGIPQVVFVWPGCFLQNFIKYDKPQTETEGDSMEPVTVFETPVRDDVLVPFVDIEKDMGSLVAAILEQPEKYVSRSVHLVGEWMIFPSLAKRWSAVTGRRSRVRRLTYDEFGDKYTEFGDKYTAVGKDFRDTMVDMYKFINRYGFYGGETQDSESANLSLETTSWEDFVRRHWVST